MKVRYLYSACIEIQTDDVRILTDPWFTGGAYDGSWHHFPKLNEPLEVIREPDLVYISHIHPDHYDPVFLRALFTRFGEKPVLIPSFERNYLLAKAHRDGFDATSTQHAVYGGTNLHIVPNVVAGESDIDSALVVNAQGDTVLNLNDCVWNDAHVTELQEILRHYTHDIDLTALGYTGAGPYPQTYYDPREDRDTLVREAENKKQLFFDRYRRYCEAFPSKRHLPFAGKYVLWGKLAELNQFRGLADAAEVLAFDDKAIVLADGGAGEIDLTTMEVTAARTEPYPPEALQARIDAVAKLPLDYEVEITLSYDKINFARLLHAAYARAQRRSEVSEDYWFVFHVERDGETQESFQFNTRRGAENFGKLTSTADLPVPRSEYFVDYRHLFGCLTAVYHWNNSEVGSFVPVRRSPNELNGAAQGFLDFFACA